MGIATAIGLGVAGIAGSALSGAGAKKSAKKANAENVRRAEIQNAENMKQYLISRGDQGNAVLPMYLRTPSEEPFEGTVLGPDLMNLYSATRRFENPVDEVAANQAILDRMQPTIDAATGQVIGLFDDTLLQRALDFQAPVQAARLDAIRGATDAALADAQNQQVALNQRRGTGIDTQSDRLVRAQLLRQAAAQLAAGKVANLQENADTQQRFEALKFSNIALPSRTAEANISLQSAPQRAAIDEFSNRMAPFAFFNIGTGAPPQYTLPTFQAEPNNLMIAGNAISSGANIGSGLMASGAFKGLGGGTPQVASPGQFSPYPATTSNMPTYYIPTPQPAPTAYYGPGFGPGTTLQASRSMYGNF